MAKILVTGGAGFIGSRFLNVMVKRYPNDYFVCLDKLTYAGDLESIQKLFRKPNFSFVKADILDDDALGEIFSSEHFDMVVHFAAESHVDRGFADPELFQKVNVEGTKKLLEYSLRYGVKRFHQVSTDEVYGDLPLSSDEKFNEASPLRPTTAYARSKAAADEAVLSYKEKLEVTISRGCNTFGPYQFPEKLIPLLSLNALLGEKLPVYGEGKEKRQYIYVDDHAEAIDLILRQGKAGEIYNVSGSYEAPNIEIAKRIIARLNKKAEISFVEGRPINDRRYLMDDEKIKKELGFACKFAFDEAFEKTLKWNKKHLNWLLKMKEKEN